ncbi:hypothetical protein J6G99_08155 [bacterium]|nr:hypothetical protein [bacterium]
MKKLLSFLTLFTFLAIPQGAFAWTYDGLGSLNPFTNFGRGFGGNSECGCKVERCVKPKLTKCEKLHGYKIRTGQPCGCAAPVIIPAEPIMETPHCTNCTRAF